MIELERPGVGGWVGGTVAAAMGANAAAWGEGLLWGE